MPLELVLDSNALVDRDLMQWLRRVRVRAVLPAVAYAELGVLWAARGRLSRARELLRELHVEVEWLTVAEAERAALSGHRVGDFADRARDHLIAGHITPGRILVTHNTDDFTFLPNVFTPTQVIARHPRGR